MEEDSRNLLKSDRKTSGHSISQQSTSLSSSFQCSHCVLIFKSKRFLFEHLGKVHGFDVDSALGDSNSAPPRTAAASNINPDVHSDNSGDHFACQHCTFTAPNWSAVFKHQKGCHTNLSLKTSALQPQKGHLKDRQLSVKRQETESMPICKKKNKIRTVKDKSWPQLKQAAWGKLNSSLLKSTSKTKHITSSSKGLKTYMRPSPGSITKYLVASSESHVKSSQMSTKSPDLPGAPGMAGTTLILHDSPSDQSNDSVFKVAATSRNDLSVGGCRFQQLSDARLLVHDPSYDSIINRPFSNQTGKRPVDNTFESPLAKKSKVDVDETGSPENVSAKTKLLSGSFMFEVSEDEEERKVFKAELDEKARLGNGDMDSSNVYYCKHCNYSSDGVRSVSVHYQKMHPYIRYHFKYIQDPDDFSATFRCLECPIEFPAIADLKKHYKEMHPEAPNVFACQTRELDMVFKCFVCSLTTSQSKLLREHYKEKHPTHKENNSLLYYKYIVSRHQEEPTQLDTCEKVSSPRSSDRITVKSTETTPPSPVSKGVDEEMHQCKNCTFSNKSVVAMLVHYRKSHPKSGVTIDQIKQMAVATSQIKPQVLLENISASSASVKLMDKSLISPQKKSPGSSMKAKVKSESSPRRKISASSVKSKDRLEVSPNNLTKSSKKKDAESSHSSLPMPGVDGDNTDDQFYCQLCNYGYPTILGVLNHQRHSHSILNQSAEAIHIHTAEVRSKGKKAKRFSPTQSVGRMSTGTGSPDTQADDLFYCQFCNYCNPSVRSVLGHQNAKHGRHMVSIEDIIVYSAEVRQSRCKVAASLSSDSNPKCAEVDGQEDYLQHEGETVANSSTPVSNPYKRAEDLFFCQQCNYGHTSIKGVVQHQTKRHRNRKSTSDQIFSYTAVVRGQIKKSKAEGKNSPYFPTGLPLPLMQEYDKEMLFCQLCNFAQKNLQRVLEHQKKRHRAMQFTAENVLTYSSVVHEQIQTSHLKATGEQAVKFVSIVHSEKAQRTKSGNATSLSQSYSKTSSQTRSLKCRKCIYETQRVYLLKRHLRKHHNMSCTVTDVLQMAFKDGALQAGYHCEWCVFSHREAAPVFQHCRKSHAERGISLAHITSRLHAGLKGFPSKKKKSCLESNDGHDHVASQAVECAKMTTSQLSGGNEAKVYPCRACSFKASSVQRITSHYHAVHPWAVKEDGSVLDVINHKVLSDRQVQGAEVHNEDSASLDGYQEPAEFESRMLHKCNCCVAHFNTRHGLHTHYGKKHPEYKYVSSDVEEVCESLTKMQVYRCPRCTYVNTSYHGLLTHCQMRHPNLTARADKLLTDEAQFPNEDCVKKGQPGVKLTYSGYMCKICPVTRVSLKKLKRHYEEDHRQTAPNMLKPAPKQSTVIKKQLLSKYLSSQGSILPAAFLKNKKSARMKCHLCKYVCTTLTGLNRHLHNHHKSTPEVESQGCVYECSLCGYSSLNRAYLAKHYKRMHGMAAFLTYYVPVHKKPKPTSPDQQTVLKDRKKVVGGQKCSMCSFQSSSEKDMMGHYATEHPKDHVQSRLSLTPAMESQEFIYKCRLCSYSTPIRKYLAAHYKRTHSRSAYNTYFSRIKESRQSTKCEEETSELFKGSAKAAPVRCRRCPKIFFNSCLLLSIHYTHFHSADFKMDFSVLASTSAKGSGSYTCSHCNAKIKGIIELCSHLDHHNEMYRKETNEASGEEPETKPVKLRKQEATPPLSPSKALVRVKSQLESRGGEGYTCKCGRTFMSLTGLRVHERSHAAMAALKRLDTLPVSSSKRIVDKYISYRPGTVKPYHCGVCSYRTNVMGLLRSHLTKQHNAECPDINMSSSMTVKPDRESTQRELEEPPRPPGLPRATCPAEPSEESDFPEKPRYSEHPDVQRQLNHYRLKTQSAAPQVARPPTDGLLHCEFCNFTSEHQSSIRRHYLHRHNGKKLLRCKDCSFFTGSRKTLQMHMETGHYNCPSGPTHQKDLRCPLCLYQTKNKNNMIDHIVLHREERMTPIELRRPKLSRYLQGVVFRCHRCTFSTASEQNLHAHLLKHDAARPYKCRLCYFDCMELGQLEAHLCEKHQVMRNHELVGQINLDQLYTRGDKVAEEDEEIKSNIKHENREEENTNYGTGYSGSRDNQDGQEDDAVDGDNEEGIEVQNNVSREEGIEVQNNVSREEGIEVQNNVSREEGIEVQNNVSREEGIEVQNNVSREEGIEVQNNVLREEGIEVQNNVSREEGIVAQNDVSRENQGRQQSDLGENVVEQSDEPYGKQEQEDTLQNIRTGDQVTETTAVLVQNNKNTTEQQKDVADQKQEHDTQVEDEMASPERQEGVDRNEEDINCMEDQSDHEHKLCQSEQKEMDENRDQQNPKDGKENIVEQSGASQRQQETAEKSSTDHDEVTRAAQVSQPHRKQTQDTRGGIVAEQAAEAGREDAKQRDRDGDVPLPGNLQDGHGPMEMKMMQQHMEEYSQGLPKNTSTQDCSTAKRAGLTDKHSGEHGDKLDEKSMALSFTCREEDLVRGENRDQPVDRYGAMPVLQNEYHREEMDSSSRDRCMPGKVEDSPEGREEHKQERVDEKIHEENINHTEIMRTTEPEDASAAAEKVTGVLCSLTSSDKLFACEFCGRNFVNRTDMERHVIRHGM